VLLVASRTAANPQGAVVTGGAAQIVQTTPSRLDINQSSNRAVIDWRSFSVGAGETTNFNQPSSSSLAVNRVTGANPSDIAGHITANGQIVLVNPNGIVFQRDHELTQQASSRRRAGFRPVTRWLASWRLPGPRRHRPRRSSIAAGSP
jgi:filamentous hemagglutinin family protein